LGCLRYLLRVKRTADGIRHLIGLPPLSVSAGASPTLVTAM
jgi:hypothetical protein